MSGEIACLKCGGGMVPGATHGPQAQAVICCSTCKWFTYPALDEATAGALYVLWKEEGTKPE